MPKAFGHCPFGEGGGGLNQSVTFVKILIRINVRIYSYQKNYTNEYLNIFILIFLTRTNVRISICIENFMNIRIPNYSLTSVPQSARLSAGGGCNRYLGNAQIERALTSLGLP